MPKRVATLTLVLAVYGLCFYSGAASVEQGLRDARQLLDKGDPDGAISLLKEAQVDSPAASELRFGIACALFVKGEHLLKSGAAEESKTAFAEARSLFESLEKDPQERIAREAAFNRATVIARQALEIANGDDYAAGVAALRNAVQAYETAVTRYPDHPEIRQNLDHVQFRLKQLLQNPPPEQEKPEEQPPILSRFGQAATDIPGAQTQIEENTAVLIPPEKQEPQP